MGEHVIRWLVALYKRQKSTLTKGLVVAALVLAVVLFGTWALLGAFGGIVLIADLLNSQSTAAHVLGAILVSFPRSPWPWPVSAALAALGTIFLGLIALRQFKNEPVKVGTSRDELRATVRGPSATAFGSSAQHASEPSAFSLGTRPITAAQRAVRDVVESLTGMSLRRAAQWSASDVDVQRTNDREVTKIERRISTSESEPKDAPHEKRALDESEPPRDASTPKSATKPPPTMAPVARSTAGRILVEHFAWEKFRRDVLAHANQLKVIVRGQESRIFLAQNAAPDPTGLRLDREDVEEATVRTYIAHFRELTAEILVSLRDDYGLEDPTLNRVAAQPAGHADIRAIAARLATLVDGGLITEE